MSVASSGAGEDEDAEIGPDSDDLDRILKGREDREAYAWFFDNVVACVTGRWVYMQKRGKELIPVWASVSDEAFGLVILENLWETWVAKFNKEEHVPPSRFTIRGKGERSDHHRWSDEGLRKYNEYCESVRKDRSKSVGKKDGFESWYLRRFGNGKKYDGRAEEKVRMRGKKAVMPYIDIDMDEAVGVEKKQTSG